ncbi:MAG: hypothetical protein JW984_01095 [Deltaproteobacteria bacterium]|uniref:Putative heavy-metal chelation domain-containing protein n=1 Tax=Candidatus Zymogenus saltonus TaxID=2844893 RepID=A0A9D8KCW3_9DELT|nr:hypothetical protein [Candidatus Zymogenus saltonus]
MNIYQEIVRALKPAALGAEVRRIVSGGIYTAVEVVSNKGGRALGLAYVEGDRCTGGEIGGCEGDRCRRGGGRSPLMDGGAKFPVSASDLLSSLIMISDGGEGKGRGVESSVATALASALAQLTLTEWETGDVLEQVSVKRGEGVTVVGGFPFTPRLAEMGAELAVFDRRLEDFDEGEMGAALNGADVVIITGAALANGTLPGILERIGGAREAIILGPTTPLVPEAFADTPVTRLMGVIPLDIDGVVEVIVSGGGTRGFSRYVQKVGVRVGK